ncbi:MAG: HNH endonuclease [Burkholderiaceae bacterium]|nr:HNH endonuclease [Microbacteriaceae bacterium]
MRILTHAETGATLSVGRDSYVVPKDARRWLQVRDETCRAVGCSKPASRCDIDHTVWWHEGGVTNYNNLAHLCQKHHTQKEETDWTVTQAPAGDETLAAIPRG